MEQINGIIIDRDFTSLIKVSDLLYFDGPLLSHFTNENGDNFLFYWVDSDDKYNRWMVVRVKIAELEKYIQYKETLYNIILSNIDGFVSFVDIDSDLDVSSCVSIANKDIPSDYLPEIDSFYASVPINEESKKEQLRQFNNSVIEIHLTGTTVGYGNMFYEDFVSINKKFQSLWESLADGYVRNCCNSYKLNHDKKHVPTGVRQEMILATKMDYRYAMAGSVRIILQPRERRERTLESMFSRSDTFADEFVNLLSSGTSGEKVRSYREQYGSDVISNYQEFVVFCDKNRLNIEVSHYSDSTDSVNTCCINNKNRAQIIENLSRENVDVETIQLQGYFYSINMRNQKYGFEDSSTQLTSEGKIALNNDSVTIQNLSFNKLYKITIERNIRQQLVRNTTNRDEIISIEEA